MVRSRFVIALIVILLISGGAFLIFSPYLTGDDYLKDFFLQQLEQNIGRKIDVHRIKLVLFPRHPIGTDTGCDSRSEFR